MKSLFSTRNLDFIAQCKKSAVILNAKGRIPTIEQVVIHALGQKAPCYYVDFYRAKSKLLNPEFLSRRHRQETSRLWKDMAKDLKRQSLKNPGKTPEQIILDLCSGRVGNPKFYISQRRAVEIASYALLHAA